jgi:hypothetical protein
MGENFMKINNELALSDYKSIGFQKVTPYIYIYIYTLFSSTFTPLKLCKNIYILN